MQWSLPAPITVDWRFVVQSVGEWMLIFCCLALSISSFFLITGILLIEHEQTLRVTVGWDYADVAYMKQVSSSIMRGLDKHIFILILFAPTYFPTVKACGLLLARSNASMQSEELNVRHKLAQRGWIVEPYDDGSYDLYLSDGTREKASNYRDLKWFAKQVEPL